MLNTSPETWFILPKLFINIKSFIYKVNQDIGLNVELLSKMSIFQGLVYSNDFAIFWLMLEIIQMNVLAPILYEDRN